jgi:hypothetical protein
VAALLAAAALAVVLGIEVHGQATRIDRLQRAVSNPLDRAVEQAIDDPGATLVELTSTDGHLVVRGAITPGGLAYLRASGLPALPAGHTYQLWGATGQALVSLGVLGPDPTVVAFHDADYALFAITAEDSPGGVVASQQAPVVKGTRAT